MKKITRNFIISGAALFAIGVAVFLIGMSVLKWDFTRLDATEYTEKKYSQVESGHDISSIKIDVDSFDVVINDGESVTLDYYEASNSEVSVSVSDGVLNIKETCEKVGWFRNGIFNLGRVNHKFVLTVVSGLPIDICGTSTSVDMRGIETEKIDADGTNVSILLSDCKISTLHVRSANVHVNAKNCEFESIDTVSNNMNMSLNDSKCSVLTAKSTNTTVSAEDSTIGSVTLDGTNINLKFENTVSDSVYADGTNIRCELNGITVNKLTLDGTNLHSRISIMGKRSEYTVIIDGDRVMGTNPEKVIVLDGVNIDSSLGFV